MATFREFFGIKLKQPERGTQEVEAQKNLDREKEKAWTATNVAHCALALFVKIKPS
jgi:hypothetical protein